MNLKEEFQDYLYQIQNELLKNTSSPLYSHLLKDFMNDSDKFMSFYDFIMKSQEVYDFEIYKGLLGPLNSFGYYAEIGEVYNKMIKIVTEGGDNGVKDTKVDV
ncbi:hypothetical protein NBO_467g0004 [Nosema bombycis CQ1]|uniref:Uncharacterized protein n=1 Tax=Nosema bombycis (strain CQ1 / CVCC 102059) TaxID=578461 RepID=R0MHN3_NOSB1|nr:hypothetical protein NBO_467g0004 [Nosema bombycis CQ1]|eukprot:EOB12303.1 hypothetical protein NBO_467g0004 [Nosema bombycis CQ1]